ncbi:sigma-E factor negative regulatory protein [Undibacterium sp. CCC2.1]|nr:sigma-E factor negative regulatory protein [Undibacterium sp. CCC2.1]MEB0171355.1 sigma-E factor negative regulatory protein [Undibacterium sp. CCC1.1]MEB0175345.1 sigma-E factor negative regulatory protein [Undibacterium sp. CCC3.4]MEB0214551.1 sigma-E factor negative regulatory protein [Undibacterium sp. 5I2]
MKNDTSKNETISALADGELDDAAIAALLLQMDETDDRASWDHCHLIADALRSDDLAFEMSSDFSARFAQRFASEPILLMPHLHQSAELPRAAKASFFRSYMAVAGASAAALLAFVLVPQLLHLGSSPELQASRSATPTTPVQLASASLVAADTMLLQAQNEAAQQNAEREMLRDPRIDSYLIAHQRFSPDISNGAAYVTHVQLRSAAEK